MHVNSTKNSILRAKPKKSIADELEKYFWELIQVKKNYKNLTLDEANSFIANVPVDYGVIADTAWKFYDNLYSRLNKPNFMYITNLTEKEIENLIRVDKWVGGD